MAKFTTYYNLAPINDTKEFLGISKDKSDGNVITTLERNIVVVLKISSQKQVQSWNSFDKLSSKVLFDPKSNQYAGVFGKRSLRLWDENITDLNKVKKISFHRNIECLVQNGADGEILVLYTSGDTESLSSAITNRKTSSQENTHSQTSLVDANIYTSNGNKVLIFFEKNGASLTMVLSILDPESLKTISSCKYNVSRRNIPLSGYCIVASGSLFEFVSIWSDKRVFIQNLNNISPSDDVVGHFTSILSTLNVDKPMSVLGLSDHCVAIYGANAAQEGASLILYNTQFKVVQAQQFFKVHFDFSNLWFFCNSIILAMGQNLSVVSFKMTRQFLSDLVGSQVQSQLGEKVGDDFINEDEELEDNLEFSEILPKIEARNNIKEKKKKEVMGADGLTVPFYPMDKFNKDILNELSLTGFKVNLIEDDEFGVTVDSVPFPTQEIEIVANEMEKCGASEQEIVEKLLYVLLKANRLNDILVCFKRYTSIPERMIAKTLSFVVESYEESDNIRTEIMKAVISCSFDEEKLAQYIRNEFQDINKILKTLEILYGFITCPEYILEERSETCYQFDEEMQIFRWVGIFLGTHFQQLILSKDDHLLSYLSKWMQLVNQYRENITGLQEVNSYLYKLFEKQTNTSDISYSKFYSVEEIKLF